MLDGKSFTTQTISENQFKQNLVDMVERHQKLAEQGRQILFDGRDISLLTLGELLLADPTTVYFRTEVIPLFEAAVA